MKTAEEREKYFRNWASGGGDRAFDVQIPGVHEFMANLFVLITTYHPTTHIDELDLFHGHVVPTEDPRDLTILFHAKEYPDDDQYLSEHQTTRAKDKGIIRDTTPKFLPSASVMSERNFLWVLSTNTLWLVGDPGHNGPGANPEFASLTAPHGSPVTKLTTLTGTVVESNLGKDLMNVNYFPGHLSGGAEQQMFFTPVDSDLRDELKPQHNALAFKTQFPELDLRLIAKVYAAYGPDPVAVRAALTKLSALLRLVKEFPLLDAGTIESVYDREGGNLQRASASLKHVLPNPWLLHPGPSVPRTSGVPSGWQDELAENRPRFGD